MCSTHNPKKHYFAARSKVCMRFTFVNQDSLSRSFMIDAAQFQQETCLAITKAILYLQTKGFNVQKYDVFLPQFGNLHLNFQTNPLIPYQKLPQKEIFFHLHKKQDEIQSEQQLKKTKQPERYIGQVIEKVKQWRTISKNQKISLKDAALIVGIPKKSLDDYFLLLRQGQITGYQYQNNLHSKMGELRAYLKKNAKKLPTGKLPFEMSQLKCYNLVSNQQNIISNNQDINELITKLKKNENIHQQTFNGSCDYLCSCDHSKSSDINIEDTIFQ